MIKKIFNLFRILRKLSTSGIVDTLDEIKKVPTGLKFIINVFSFGSSK